MWREVLYQPPFWKDIRPVLHCRELRQWDSDELLRESKKGFYLSIKLRGCDNVCLLHANDGDVFDFIQNYPHGATNVHSLVLRCCNMTDRGLEALLEFMTGVYSLEINGCNEITEQGLWSSLQPRLVSLTVTDCINWRTSASAQSRNCCRPCTSLIYRPTTSPTLRCRTSPRSRPAP